jgi:hypothetical protein
MKFFLVEYESLESYPGSSHWAKTSRIVVAKDKEKAIHIAAYRANRPLPRGRGLQGLPRNTKRY